MFESVGGRTCNVKETNAACKYLSKIVPYGPLAGVLKRAGNRPSD